MATQSPDVEFQVWDTLSSPYTHEGSLDVSSSVDFPIALTFTIKDVMDITKSKGSFSKTFKLPATRNNNELLKNLFADGFYDVLNYVEHKIAKIYFNSQLVMEGGFKIKATVIDTKPLEYECLVFGENYKWVNELDRQNLCDIDWSVGNMFDAYPDTAERTRANVMDTWHYDSSDHLRSGVGTHIVYPLVNRGKWNNQNKVHYTDLIPAWWIRNLVYQITISAGYTLVSNFMDSDWFKRLITLFGTTDDVWEQTITTQTDNAFNFEIIGPTEWKIPMDYRDVSIGNRFDGAILWDHVAWIGPNFNSASDWAPQDILPSVCDTSSTQKYRWSLFGAYGGTDLSATNYTISGWCWEEHALGQLKYGQSFHKLHESFCCDPIMRIIGHSWNEVWTWGDYTCSALPDCAGTHEEQLRGVNMFSPSVADEYTFSGELQLEMNNDYVRDNEPAPYCCDWIPLVGTGFNYHDGGYWHNDPAYGYGWDAAGVHFYGCVYLAWVHHDSRYTEFIKLDCYTAPSPDLYHHGWWAAGGAGERLEPSPDNLMFPLSFSNVLIDVTDTQDKFYYYTEVNEVLQTYNGFAGFGYDGHMQCKYRIQRGTFEGGLTSSVTTTTVTDIDISTLLPCDTTQLDYINGLTGLFNLYWQSDEENKILYCEPRDDFFYSRNEAVDWSQKLDFSTKQTSKFIYDALNRDLCFTYQDDGADGFVEERNRLVGQICSLYSYALDLGTLYKDAESKIGTSLYAPTYMFRDKSIGSNQGKSPYIPVIHSDYNMIWNQTDSNQFPDRISDFMPRVLLWGGLIPLNLEDGQSSSNTWSWCLDNPVSSPEQKKNYPFAGMLHDEDEQFFPALSVGGYSYYPTLPYNDVEANRVQPTPVPPDTYPFCQGLYQVFWERSIENILQRPRLKKAKFLLNTTDIANLDLRKLVYLETGTESTYWIINKITDYKPGKNLLTIVELYQYIPATPMKSTHNPKSGTRRSNENSVTRDFIVGQGRLEENNMSLLHNQGLSLYNYDIGNSPLGASVFSPNEGAGDYFDALVDLGYDTIGAGSTFAGGGSMPKHSRANESFNFGIDNKVMQNTGVVALGNNLSNLKQGKIYIGTGSASAYNNAPIQFVQNGKTSLAIDGSGNILEGGGGAIMAQDGSGNYFEVFSKKDFFGDITVRKVLKQYNNN